MSLAFVSLPNENYILITGQYFPPGQSPALPPSGKTWTITCKLIN